MNLLEIVDKRNNKLKELEDFTKKVKLEKRKMNDDENISFIEIKNKVESLNTQIDNIKNADEKALRNDDSIQKNKNLKMNTNFSLITAIREAVNGSKFSEETLEVIEAGRLENQRAGFSNGNGITLPFSFEKRGDLLSTTDAQGGFAVSKDYFNILAPLTNNLVFTKAGSTYLSGLVGNLVIPTYSGTASSWQTEAGAATDGAGTFAQVTFTPKKLTTKLVISKQLLTQDAVGIESMLRDNLVSSIVTKLESTILSVTSGATQPAGLFSASPTYTSQSAVTFSKVVALEGTIDTANALTGNLAYITHPKVKSLLKTTAKFANGYAPIMEGNELNGYPVFVTSSMASTLQTGANESGVVFGNFKDLVIASWGALDILVDPYSLSDNAEIKLVITGYWDAKFLRTASYSLGSFIA